MDDDLYKVLDVEKTSTTEEIKKAYRKLSLKHHPDRNQCNAESTKKFQEISAAYEILGDVEKRKNYDSPQQRHGFTFHNGSMNINPQDLFNFFTSNSNIFKPGQQGPHMQGPGIFNMNGHPMMNKPVPIIKNMEITLMESYTGCTKPLIINRWIIEDNMRRQENETLYIVIPKGVDNNEIIIIRNKGNSQSDTNKGDIKIFIKVINKTDFKRAGLDLIYQKQITLKEALCGFTFDMKYIDDRIFKINNGNGHVITPNYKKMIPKMGMIRGDHTGNLIIEFDITFPQSLDTNIINELNKIL